MVNSIDGAFTIFNERGISLGSNKFEIGKDDNGEGFFYSQITYLTSKNESTNMLVVVYVDTDMYTAKLALQPARQNNDSIAAPILVMFCH